MPDYSKSQFGVVSVNFLNYDVKSYVETALLPFFVKKSFKNACIFSAPTNFSKFAMTRNPFSYAI